MKRTPEDTAFALEFGQELSARYENAKRSGISDHDFAKSIGVVRAQLDRYLRGEAVPGVRTVALAYRKYGVALRYGETPIVEALTKRARRRKGILDQLELPFTVWAEGPRLLDLKFRPVSARKFALQVTIKKAQ